MQIHMNNGLQNRESTVVHLHGAMRLNERKREKEFIPPILAVGCQTRLSPILLATTDIRIHKDLFLP